MKKVKKVWSCKLLSKELHNSISSDDAAKVLYIGKNQWVRLLDKKSTWNVGI